MFYPRSALKYCQILPLLENGCMEKYNFTLEEISVMCASHGRNHQWNHSFNRFLIVFHMYLDSEPRHLELVRSILAKVGLDETDLRYIHITYSFTKGILNHLRRCGGHFPGSESAAIEYVRCGVCNFSKGIYNNCSGKHAGFLALAKHIGAPTETYLNKDHPVQKLVQAAACDVFGIDPSQLHIGLFL